ncbi:MAG: MFS transporter [Clostridia bacterium]
MGYTYDINTSKKDKCSTICLSSCHLLFSIINLFLSTFLIAHIYTLTSDIYSYIFNVGLFQLTKYAFMLVSYFLFSFWVDKSNRIWVYRVANIIEVCFVILTIFRGEDIAKLVVLAGTLNGISHGAYYASYNVLRQEMVSRNSTDKVSVVLAILGKIINVICPILLGALIEISTFSSVAVYVLVISLVQITLSFFIRSKKPENSEFNIKKYFKRLKEKPKIFNKIKQIYIICVFYGCLSTVSILLNINIMMQFGSSFSLGAVTSIFSLVSIIVLILTRKFTKEGKRTWLYITTGILLLASAMVFIIIPNVATLIIYHLCLSVCDVIVAVNFDIVRNKHLKEAGLYQDIAEHQCVVESIFQVLRIITFGLLVMVGLIKNYILLQVMFILFVSAYPVLCILLSIYEKKNK